MARTYYEALQIQCSASTAVIKAAYKALSQIYHPDKPGGNAELMKELVQAYEVLSDPKKRQEYDNQLNFEKQKEDSTENINAVANIMSAIITKKVKHSSIKFTWNNGENKDEFGVYVFAEDLNNSEFTRGVSLPYLAYYISKSLKSI